MFSVSSGAGPSSGAYASDEAEHPGARRRDSAAAREFLDQLTDVEAWPGFVAILGDMLPAWGPWPKGVGVQFRVEAGDGERPFLHRYGSPQSPYLALTLSVDALDGERSASVVLMKGRERLDTARFSGLPQGFFDALAAGLAMAKRHLPKSASASDLPDGERLRSALSDWLGHHPERLSATLWSSQWGGWLRPMSKERPGGPDGPAVAGSSACEPPLGPQMSSTLLASIQARAKSLADTLRAGRLPDGFLRWLPHLLIRQPVDGDLHWPAMYVEREGAAQYYACGPRVGVSVKLLRELADGSFEAGHGIGQGTRYNQAQDALFHALFWMAKGPPALAPAAIRMRLADQIEAHPLLVALSEAVSTHWPEAADKESLLRHCLRDGRVTLAGYQLLVPESVTRAPINRDDLRRWECQPDFGGGDWRQRIFQEGFSVLEALTLMTPCGLTNAGKNLRLDPFNVYRLGPGRLPAGERLGVLSELLHVHGTAAGVTVVLGISSATWCRWWSIEERDRAYPCAQALFDASTLGQRDGGLPS